MLHVYMVSFPGQGHVNPLLRLGKRLASKGLLVTVSAPEFVGQQMREANHISSEPVPVGPGLIRFEFFDDGLDDEDPKRKDLDLYMAQLELIGKEELPRRIKNQADKGQPVSCLINNCFIPWVCDVAETLEIPNAVLWVQSCASFSAYYHFHHKLVPFPSETDPELDVQLPSMPLLKHDEVPSFLHPCTPYPFLRRAILGQFKNLLKAFCILMDTFQELEDEIIEYMSNICPIKAVGPLFKETNDSVSSVLSADFFTADNCLDWLDTMPASSVVYISFGSIVHLKQEQIDQIAYGLIEANVPFLWVVRPPPKEKFFLPPHVLPEGFLEKVRDNGKIVQWSPQDKVLAHNSIACFMTHCGWNSTIEALSSGVPVVVFPQWGDQVTDAKFLVDVFKIGVRMCRGEAEERIVPREEVAACLREATSGPVAAKMRENALKWKKAAEEAVGEGGSSNRNMQDFVNEVIKMNAGGKSLVHR